MTQNPPTPSPRRRLPAPKLPPDYQRPRRPASRPPSDNPFVKQISGLIQQMAAASGLSAHVLLTDWLGMLDSGLKMWPANMRTMALENRFIEDPPDIQALFRQARERYLHASETRPAVYRQMQAAFSEAFGLLLESSAAGLAAAGDNPDVIGQLFVACLRPGRRSPWWHYFPPWPDALSTAQAAIPDGELWVHLTLADAAMQAREDGHPIELVPGVNFPEWLDVVLPYVEPVELGPPLIDSSPALLAAAVQFPPWALKTNLISFSWDHIPEPLIRRLLSINAMLYGLNGYLLTHAAALADIDAHLRRQQDAAPPESPLPQSTDPPPPHPGPSFADLFRTE